MNVIKKMMLLVIILSAVSSVIAQNTNGNEGVFTPFEELEWYNPMEGAPIKFAAGSGKTFETAHSTFGKFPGNFTTPMHTHSYSYQAIVISGIMTNPMAGDNVKVTEMGPGSYWYVPANQAHKTACVSKEPCVFYMYQPTSFNFTPVENK